MDIRDGNVYQNKPIPGLFYQLKTPKNFTVECVFDVVCKQYRLEKYEIFGNTDDATYREAIAMTSYITHFAIPTCSSAKIASVVGCSSSLINTLIEEVKFNSRNDESRYYGAVMDIINSWWNVVLPDIN